MREYNCYGTRHGGQMHIGHEVRQIRESKGWSQAKLAAAADMAVSGVSQIETGARNPSAVTLQKLARALDAEVADFFPKAQGALPFEENQPSLTSQSREERRLIEVFELFRTHTHMLRTVKLFLQNNTISPEAADKLASEMITTSVIELTAEITDGLPAGGTHWINRVEEAFNALDRAVIHLYDEAAAQARDRHTRDELAKRRDQKEAGLGRTKRLGEYSAENTG